MTTTDPQGIECYAAPSLTAKHTAAYVDSDVGLTSPQAQCAPFFARGYLAADRRVPPLRACVGDGRVSVFPARDDEVCRRLGLDPLPASAYRAETTRILRAFRLVNAEIERALLEDQDASTIDAGLENCLRGRTGVARLQAVLERAGLTDFRVRPAPGALEEDCFEDVAKPEPFDGRTIELETDATLGGTYVDAKPTPSARQRRRSCDRVFAKAAGRGMEGVLVVLDCEIEPPGCLTVAETRLAAKRALRRARLEGWIASVRREPGAMGQRLTRSTVTVDDRLRQLGIELTECQ